MRRALLLAAALPACQVPDVTFSVAPEDCVVSPSFPVQTNPLTPKAVAIGDVNADGRPDIVVTDQGNDTISVLISSTTALRPGDFETRVEYLTGAQPSGLALADVNGDGKLDAVVGNAGDGTLSVLLGTGDTDVGFLPQRIVQAGGSPIALVAADLDGDGKLDIAVLNGGGGVGVLLGNGDGTFRAAVSYPAGDGAEQLVVADVNGDHAQDLIVRRTSDTGNSIATLLIGNGDGTFQAAVDRDLGATATWITTGELNGDGKLDLAVTRRGRSAPGTVSILLGSGDGHFTPGGDVATDQGPVTVAIADMNGDGKPDLVVNVQQTPRPMARGGAIDVMLGNGDGTFRGKVDQYGSLDPVTFAVADLNGDHIPDVVTLSGADATVSSIIAAADGTLILRADYLLGTGPSSIAFGDITGDGETDAAVADQMTTAVAVEVVSLDGFVARVEAPTKGTPVAPLMADLNGDGELDIAAAGVDRNAITVALRSLRIGGANALFARTFDLDTAAGPVAIAAGDLDHDGKPDLVVAARSAGMVSVFINRGNGNFAPRVDYPAGEEPSAIAIADAGGGAPAVIVANRGSSTISVLVANPDGTLRTRVDHPTGPQPVALAVRDVTGDHVDDVVVANYAGRGVTVFAGNGGGTFRSLGDFATGAGPASVAIVDLVHSAMPAIVVANANSRSLSILHSDGKGGFASAINHTQVDRPLAVGVDPKRAGEVGLLLDSITQNVKTATVGVCLQ